MSKHTTTTHKSTGTVDLTDDEIYEVLSSKRRRDLLAHLTGSDGMTKRDLVEIVTELEYGENYSSAERKRILVSLHQCHLPKLDDLDVVEYSDDDRTVRPGPNAAVVQRYRHDSRSGGDGLVGRIAGRI